MLNRSQSICLSFMILAVHGMYAAYCEQIVANDPASRERQLIKFKYEPDARREEVLEPMRPVCAGTGPIPTRSASSELDKTFNLATVRGGVPLIHKYAQSTNPFWRSFGIALGFSTAWVTSGLYFKLTPEQVAKIATYASLGFIVWGAGSQIFRSAIWNTDFMLMHNPGVVDAFNRECEYEVQIARGHQMLQLATMLHEANVPEGSDEELHNNSMLPKALEQIRTDGYDTTILSNRLMAHVKRRYLVSSVGYVAGGIAGLGLAHSLKRLA